MSTEIYRLKRDMQTIEQALGCEPEFGRGTVWASVGWGVFGLGLIALDLLPYKIPTHWNWLAAVILIALWLGLPHLLARLAVRFSSPQTFGAAQTLGSSKDLGSLPLTAIIMAFLLAMGLWMNKLALPSGLFLAATCFVGGLGCLHAAWGRPWRRGLLVWAVAYAALGFAFPFLGRGTVGIAMGAAVAFAGFAGAILLNSQLNTYYAHGKAAH